MANLTIHFEGICTQIKLAQAIGNVLHRAVLVHAENGMTMLDHAIPPHVAFLMMDPEVILASDLDAFVDNPAFIQQPDGNWQLFGIRLSVANAVGSGVTYTPSSFAVPSLTALTPDFGPLSPSVVFQTDAACHFDVTAGTFTSVTGPEGAISTTLTIETTDPSPILRIETLATTDGAPNAKGSLTLASGSTIEVANTGGTLGDTPFDFLLHYLTANTFPKEAAVPRAAISQLATVGAAASTEDCPRRIGAASREDSPRRIGDAELGPGCSNSSFP